MTAYRFSPRAFRDLLQIGDFIASENAEAARRVVRAIYATCRSIPSSPLAGIIRDDLTSLPVRFRLLLPYRSHWIIYDPASTPIEIIRVLHTSMDIPTDAVTYLIDDPSHAIEAGEKYGIKMLSPEEARRALPHFGGLGD